MKTDIGVIARRRLAGLGLVAWLGIFAPGAAEAEDIRRYGIASAIIHYKLSGSQTGEEQLSFDQYGMLEIKKTQSQLQAGQHSVAFNKLTLTRGTSTFVADLNTHIATEMPTPLLEQSVAAAKKEGRDLTDLGMHFLKHSGAVKIGEGTVAGKPCEIWEIKGLGSRYWMWHGIILKSDTHVAGQNLITEATSVEENPVFPPGTFELPQGITVRKSNPSQQLTDKSSQAPAQAAQP